MRLQGFPAQLQPAQQQIPANRAADGDNPLEIPLATVESVGPAAADAKVRAAAASDAAIEADNEVPWDGLSKGGSLQSAVHAEATAAPELSLLLPSPIRRAASITASAASPRVTLYMRLAGVVCCCVCSFYSGCHLVCVISRRHTWCQSGSIRSDHLHAYW